MFIYEGKQTLPTQWTLYEVRIYLPNGSNEYNAAGRTGWAYPQMDTPYNSLDGREYNPESWVMLCPKCGTVWARRYALLKPEINNWQAKRWPCLSHGNGSLWDSWNENWNKSLPYPLLVREMEILADWWEEGIRTHLQYFQYKHFGRKV